MLQRWDHERLLDRDAREIGTRPGLADGGLGMHSDERSGAKEQLCNRLVREPKCHDWIAEKKPGLMTDPAMTTRCVNQRAWRDPKDALVPEECK